MRHAEHALLAARGPTRRPRSPAWPHLGWPCSACRWLQARSSQTQHRRDRARRCRAPSSDVGPGVELSQRSPRGPVEARTPPPVPPRAGGAPPPASSSPASSSVHCARSARSVSRRVATSTERFQPPRSARRPSRGRTGKGGQSTGQPKIGLAAVVGDDDGTAILGDLRGEMPCTEHVRVPGGDAQALSLGKPKGGQCMGESRVSAHRGGDDPAVGLTPGTKSPGNLTVKLSGVAWTTVGWAGRR